MTRLPGGDLDSVAVGAQMTQMAKSGTRSFAQSDNIVKLVADSADALDATDVDGRNAVLALDQAPTVSNASGQLIS